MSLRLAWARWRDLAPTTTTTTKEEDIEVEDVETPSRYAGSHLPFSTLLTLLNQKPEEWSVNCREIDTLASAEHGQFRDSLVRLR